MQRDLKPAPPSPPSLPDSEDSTRRTGQAATQTLASSAAPLPDVEAIVRSADQQVHQLAALKEAIFTFLRRDARLGQLRERTLLLRSRAKFAWSNCHSYRNFVKESQETYNTEAAKIALDLAVEDHAERLSRLRRAHDQVIEDFDTQNELAENANALQTRLSALEYELQVKEVSVKESAETIRRILGDLVLPGYSSAATTVETEVLSSPSLDQSEDVHPFVQDYFDKAGNLTVLTEQAMEIEADYVDEQGERQFRLDHDHILETTEEQFEMLWQKKKKDITDQISDAARMAEAARLLCIDNGLDPEESRRRPQRDSDRALSETVFETVSDQMRRALPTDLDQLSDGNGSVASTEPLDEDMISDVRVVTAGSVPSMASRGWRTGEGRSIPAQDRVRNWIAQVDDQDSCLSRADGEYLPSSRRTEFRRRRQTLSFPLENSSSSQTPLPILVSGVPAHENAASSLRASQDSPRRSMRRYTSESNLKERLPGHHPTPELLEELRRFATSLSNARGSSSTPAPAVESDSTSSSASEESDDSSGSDEGDASSESEEEDSVEAE